MAEEINQNPIAVETASTEIPNDLPEVNVTLMGKIVNFFHKPVGKIIGFTGIFLGVAGLIMYSNGLTLKGSFVETTPTQTPTSTPSQAAPQNQAPSSTPKTCETGKYLDQGQAPKDCKALPNILLITTEKDIQEACTLLQNILLKGSAASMDTETETKIKEQTSSTLCKPSLAVTPTAVPALDSVSIPSPSTSSTQPSVSTQNSAQTPTAIPLQTPASTPQIPAASQAQTVIPQSFLAEAVTPKPTSKPTSVSPQPQPEPQPQSQILDESSLYPAAASYAPRSMTNTGPEWLIYSFGIGTGLWGGRKMRLRSKK